MVEFRAIQKCISILLIYALSSMRSSEGVGRRERSSKLDIFRHRFGVFSSEKYMKTSEILLVEQVDEASATNVIQLS